MAMNGHKSEGVSAIGQAGGTECSGPTYARAVMNAATVYPTGPDLGAIVVSKDGPGSIWALI